MIKWCAYCQSFLGELPPHESLIISHGICKPCKNIGAFGDDSRQPILAPLIDLQKELYTAGLSGDTSKIPHLIERSQKIGVQPLDMIFGFLSPMLVQIGVQWEKGITSVREEHLFTNFAESLLLSIQNNSSTKLSPPPNPNILLVSADGNYHTFGLKLIHLWLNTKLYTSELISPGLPMNELLTYTKTTRPKFVGISISLRSQVTNLQNYIQTLQSELRDDAPKVLVGGYAIKARLIDAAEIAPARLVSDILELSSIL